MAILYDFRCERRERLAYTTRKTNTAQEWPTRLSRPYSQLWKYRDDLIRDRRISHRVRFSERLRRDRNGRAECKRPLFWPGETKETMFDYSGRGARPSSSSSSKGAINPWCDSRGARVIRWRCAPHTADDGSGIPLGMHVYECFSFFGVVCLGKTIAKTRRYNDKKRTRLVWIFCNHCVYVYHKKKMCTNVIDQLM